MANVSNLFKLVSWACGCLLCNLIAQISSNWLFINNLCFHWFYHVQYFNFYYDHPCFFTSMDFLHESYPRPNVHPLLLIYRCSTSAMCHNCMLKGFVASRFWPSLWIKKLIMQTFNLKGEAPTIHATRTLLEWSLLVKKHKHDEKDQKTKFNKLIF